MRSVLQMCLLDGFVLEYQNEVVPVASQRLQSLLAYLALNRTHPQPRQRLAFLLWPDSSESQAHTNLRTLLHRLRSVLPNADAVLQIDAEVIGWHPTLQLNLDVADFEAAVHRAIVEKEIGHDADAREHLERAVAYYKEDLLPDCYDEWVLAERERLRQVLFTALEQLTMLCEQHKAVANAISYARRLVRLDPLNEAAYLSLMRLYAVNGERASALRIYHTCTSRLQSELGFAPGLALQTLYEQLLAANLPPAVPTTTTPLIGRERDWQRIQATWQVVSAGQPRLLILSGEAGIGKTRLLEEFLRYLGRQGVIAAAARCYAAEGGLAYAPVSAWLRADTLRANLMRLNASDFSEAARLAPDLLTQRPDVPPAAGPLAESWQRQRLFEALARAVLGVGRPTILALDDLQWCAIETLEWVHFLLRFDLQARLLIIGTLRTEEVGAAHPLTGWLNTLHCEERVVEVALERLSREETAQLAGSIMGCTLSKAQLAYLYKETEGNPFFVVEMLNAGLPSDMESASEIKDLAPGIQAVIRRRLDQVTPAARVLLDAAAVIGRSFTFEVLARVTGVDEDALVLGLDELWRRRIVREQGRSAYDFTHDKLRAVAYSSLSAARQRLLHRRVAEALEAENRADRHAASGQIAAHYEKAGMIALAVTYYQRAAQHTRRLYANASAINYYRRALKLLDDPAQPEAVALYDQLGEVLHLVGQYHDARALWRRALDITQSWVSRAHLHRKLGNAWRDQYNYEDAQREYDAAEAALGKDNNKSDETWLCWIQITCDRIMMFYWLNRTDMMLDLIDQIRPVIAEHGSTVQQAQMHQLSTIALLRRDRYGESWEAVDHARTYLRLIGEANAADMLPAAHFQLGFALLWANALDEAEAECSAALELAERSGDVSLQGRCLTYLAVIARKRGAVQEAQAWAERSLRVAAACQMPDYTGAAHGNLAWAAWRADDFTVVRSHGQEAMAAWQKLPSAYMFEWIGRWSLIGILLAEGNTAELKIHARALLDESQQRPPAALEAALEAIALADDDADICAYLSAIVGLAREQGYL